MQVRNAIVFSGTISPFHQKSDARALPHVDRNAEAIFEDAEFEPTEV